MWALWNLTSEPEQLVLDRRNLHWSVFRTFECLISKYLDTSTSIWYDAVPEKNEKWRCNGATFFVTARWDGGKVKEIHITRITRTAESHVCGKLFATNPNVAAVSKLSSLSKSKAKLRAWCLAGVTNIVGKLAINHQSNQCCNGKAYLWHRSRSCCMKFLLVLSLATCKFGHIFSCELRILFLFILILLLYILLSSYLLSLITYPYLDSHWPKPNAQNSCQNTGPSILAYGAPKLSSLHPLHPRFQNLYLSLSLSLNSN